MLYKNNFDIIVIGGGHAGIEASLASSRMGCNTLLLTHNIDTIGQLSCNPAIGGIGKSHLVKEIDAMGGLMAQAIDKSGIQFRKLNSSKGFAVRATRIQADKIIYQQTIRNKIFKQPNLQILQQSVNDLIINNNTIKGVITQLGIKLYSHIVILTTGTFLNGKIYIGFNSYNGGRSGEKSDKLLSNKLKDFSFKIKRLKTGTPPRLNLHSINFSILKKQYSDNPIPLLSFLHSKNKLLHQVPCYITHTNYKTHEIINSNLSFSPIFNGSIKSIGPRYCPSIEDKMIKFPHRNSHQIFLEPEGLTSNEIYPNGLSTSFPLNIQIKIINSIKGLKTAQIIRPGYSVEYDFFNPIDLKLSLESKIITRLFFAGQINGTTGYEEAAAQGLLAGLNAALIIKEKEQWIPRRDQAYIGVLVDDLCTLGTIEPYRMFTSRAEYRLMLREDNADLRLTEIGRKLGLVNDNRWLKFCQKRELIEKETQKLRNIWIYPHTECNKIINIKTKNYLSKKINGEVLLKRPEINFKFLRKLKSFDLLTTDETILEQIEIQIKYHGYISKQKKEVLNLISKEYMFFPKNIKFNEIIGLSNEVISKLTLYKPDTIGQASRIPGITPAAISILLIWLQKNHIK